MFGTAKSKTGQALLRPPHSDVVTEDEFRRVALGLDCQSPELGAYNDVGAQKRVKLVWLGDDVDPQNATAVERWNNT
jgi:hypothetical protein